MESTNTAKLTKGEIIETHKKNKVASSKGYTHYKSQD